MITAWDIYWVMQLDSIGALFFAIEMLGFAMAVTAFLALPFWADSDMCKPSLRKWIIGLPLAVCGVGGFGTAFTPSTKTGAMMLVIPAVANNEAIQREAGDLYGIAKDALRELAKPKQEAAK